MLSNTLKKVNNENKKLKYLAEKEMLDISIENADKIKNKADFLKKTFKVEEKFDGTKLSIWRNNNEWHSDYTKNWVISFKNQILFKDEFEYTNRENTKKFSVGISQYAFIHDHLKKIHSVTKDIPVNTEFFIEFIQNKLTTTRNYNNKHGMYLIASSPASAKIEGGIIKSTPVGFFQDKNDYYATMLGLNLPPIIFEGTLDSVNNITRGIKLPTLEKVWNSYKSDYDTKPYESIKQLFLNFESTLGGIPEGVVMYSSDGDIYKFVQDDQYSKDIRFLKRDKYQADVLTENKYWSEIHTFIDDKLIDDTYKINSVDYNKMLNNLNKTINLLTDDQLEKIFKFKIDAMIEQQKIGV